jgi:L-aspartate oxidase
MADRIRHDGVLIVGAGLAGLSAALAAAPRKALVLAGAALNHGCSSAWAQGGLAAALSHDDAPALHAADTVAAGAGLVDASVAKILTEDGPDAISWPRWRRRRSPRRTWRCAPACGCAACCRTPAAGCAG